MFIVESRASLEKHNLSQSLVIADYKGYLFIIPLVNRRHRYKQKKYEHKSEGGRKK